MRSWEDKPSRKTRIEIIPMIDVMMFLLVFFVLISQNVIPAFGVKTKLPTASQSDDMRSANKRVVVTITKDGALQVDGAAVDLTTLVSALQEKEKASNGKLVVVINGDEAAHLQSLIEVMDTLKGNGFESLSIATKRKPH